MWLEYLYLSMCVNSTFSSSSFSFHLRPLTYNCLVAKDDLELLILLPPLAVIRGVCHYAQLSPSLFLFPFPHFSLFFLSTSCSYCYPILPRGITGAETLIGADCK